MWPLQHGYRPARAGIAGTVAATLYAVEMYADMHLTGSRFDDIQLIESAIHRRAVHPPLLGWALHLLNGAALGEIYAGLAEPRLPGPRWLRGLLFGHVFLLVAWPTTPLVDRFHPLIQAGELPRLFRPLPFVQNLARHTVFGLALGLLYQPGR